VQDDRPHTSRIYGMFSEWVGIDATSIWAAATSGPAAITVHLLACILARLFTVSEATSIWFELVERRQEQLKKAESEGLADDSDISASKCQISRLHLAEWDASARAWLRTADKAMENQHTRLMRALEGLCLSIPSGSNVLQCVIEACTASLEGMEKLICGTAQRAQSPAALLGLSCWHIYPDLLVLGADDIAPIKQNDPLVAKGGLLTIGMQVEGGTGQFLSWSLPLSFLRRYGDPVVAEGYAGLEHSRISPDELRFVTLGCLFALWGTSFSDNDLAASCICFIADLIRQSKPKSESSGMFNTAKIRRTQSWLSMLEGAATRFSGSKGEERRDYARLISFGRRNCAFLGGSHRRLPRAVVPVEGSDSRTLFSMSIEKGKTSQRDQGHEPMFGFIDLDTIIQCLKDVDSRIAFMRNVAAHLNLDPRRYLIRYQLPGREQGEVAVELASIAPVMAVNSHKRARDGQQTQKNTIHHVRFRSRSSIDLQTEPASHNEHFVTIEDHFFALFSSSWNVVTTNPLVSIVLLAEHAINDDSQPVPAKRLPVNIDRLEIAASSLIHLLDGCRFDYLTVLHRLQESIISKEDLALRGMLLCVVDILNIYKLLPSASISTKILQRPIPVVLRPDIDDNTYRMYPSRTVTFAIVAYCESGHCVVDSASLAQVFALSTGDSIFIYGALLEDPALVTESHELRRLHGNIGRPGIAFLISPINLRVRKSEANCWRVINHDAYDHRTMDSFSASSLHLSFTNFILPLSLQDSGNRDMEAYHLESFVSVYDKDKWVADIDVLNALNNTFRIPKACEGRCNEESNDLRSAWAAKLISVDCWEELLEPPERDLIARAHGNWIGRLALVSLCSQLDYVIAVLPAGCCSECLEQTEELIGDWRQFMDRQGMKTISRPSAIIM
jgi:hypothetical protein